MTAHANAPVIIKRKKVIAGGHHGGAWKVAYADFVTAMMAFFLLMWLLGTTSENQRKGIADYFNPTIPIARVSGGGSGAFNGENVFSEENLAQSGSGGSNTYHSDGNQSRGVSGVEITETAEAEAAQSQQLAELGDILTGRSGESMVSEEMARHIVTRVTDEGLIVELFDLPDVKLFEGDSAVPTRLLESLIGVVVEVFDLSPNRVAIGGHVKSQPVVLRQISTWETSVERANAVRGLVLADGLNDARIQRITGFADRQLVVANPMSVRNNRIELILLRTTLG